MADPTSNRYVNERPRGVLVLAYEVGLLRFHVLDGTRFESTLSPFHPLQQWEESCSRFCCSKKTFCLKNIHLCCFLLAHSINESNQWCPPFSGPHNLAICEIIDLSPAALWWNHPPNETNKNFTMLSDESSVSNILHLAKLMYFTNMDFPSNRRFPLLNHHHHHHHPHPHPYPSIHLPSWHSGDLSMNLNCSPPSCPILRATSRGTTACPFFGTSQLDLGP